MNKVVMVGRLAQDPKLFSTTNGNSVCSFSIAVDRRRKAEGQPTADFFNCTAWGKIGENINQYLKKGRQIALEGRLENHSYEKDGHKITATDVIVESFDFIGKKDDTGVNIDGDLPF